ncbi:hypothetical protein POSPLADRAFT_1075545 [Postia placenta MAD-698-R-SB12]|uniref:Uncharacterized protein n=1 Tax=Postia placenta MAD-698-R-SB12 TaxID=670580 RepID=A0A1X6MT27_9APHY|nr:hypothetical protein POSPLADRAFT_1075545 [Postia placenta MAD-698-R-SB12]OSX59323.1 hypothetical protein POSPLADRAFT_1075545 [Postia placenta MAD-698-R-SB12]
MPPTLHASSSRTEQPKKAPTRGKVVQPRYANPTASTARATASVPALERKQAPIQLKPPSNGRPTDAPANGERSGGRKHGAALRAPVSQTGSVPTGPSTSRSDGNVQDAMRGNPPSGLSASSSRHKPVTNASRPAVRPAAPASTSDTLQVAAQTQSWDFMRSTLEAHLDYSRRTAATALEKVSEKLTAEEAGIADARIRLEAERLLLFYDELSDAALSTTAPAIVQGFLKHEEECSRVIPEALALTDCPMDETRDIRDYNMLLDQIDALQSEAGRLQALMMSVSPAEKNRAVSGLLSLLPVLRLATLHPAISHTLGPSTTFSCPPVTRISTSEGLRTCTTYAVVESSPDIDKEDRGRTVWVWEEQLSGGVMSRDMSAKKRTAVMPRPISHIHVPDELPGYLLLVDARGALGVADQDLNMHSTFDALDFDETVTLFRHFVFPRSSYSFVSNRELPSQGVLVVSFLRKDEGLSISVASIDQDGRVQKVGACPVPVGGPDVIDVSAGASGFISVLTHSGTWHSFRLSNEPEGSSHTFTLAVPTEPLHLTTLSFAASYAPASSNPRHREHALLALTSSHVLLAGIANVPGTGPELVFLLWDLQYGVLLAEQHSAMPSTLGRTKQRGITLSLVHQSPGHALLVLSPEADTATLGVVDTSGNPLRTSVLVVPYTVPATSTIANALGRASAGAKWVKQQSPKSGKQVLRSDIDGQQTKLLNSMRPATEKKQIEVVEKLFDEWVRGHEGAAQPPADATNGEQSKPRLGHLFVKQVLDIVLTGVSSGSTGVPAPHAPKVVRSLLERRAVSNGMVEGGLLPALLARQDWQSIVLAIDTVSDLPEPDLAVLLASVVSHHRLAAPDEDAMQVDAPATPPALASFLAQCATYPTAPSALKVALHQSLPAAEDVVCVLAVLDAWIARWGQAGVKLLPDHVAKDAHGVPVPLYDEAGAGADMPPLDKILGFTQAVIDASFLALLAHPPAHALLRTLLAHLQPELALLSELQALAGPLQPFAAAHARAVHDGAHGASKVDTRVDWRRRKKTLHEQNQMSLGVYQVEELVI